MKTDKEVLDMKKKKMNAAQRALYDTAHARKGGRRKDRHDGAQIPLCKAPESKTEKGNQRIFRKVTLQR